MLDTKKSVFANIYSVVEAEVNSNPFSLDRGVISVWAVTCRRRWISPVLNSWRVRAPGEYKDRGWQRCSHRHCSAAFLHGLLLKQRPMLRSAFINPNQPATAWVRARSSTLAYISWSEYGFFLCPSVVGHILLCGPDVTRKPSRSWVGTRSWCKVIPSGPCNKPGLGSQKGWCYPELYSHFEQSREGGNQLLIPLAKQTGTVTQAVPILLLQMGHYVGVQHSCLCPLAEPAALLSTLWK